jgi:GNAT superfamily N-acetyltransferase
MTSIAASARPSTSGTAGDLSFANELPRATDAAALLRRAWAAPSMRYSDEYVAWQLSSPGGTTRGVAARDDGRLVGFVAAIPRRIADRADTPRAIPVVSLFAVDPACRGAGIGRRLIAGLFDAVGPELLLYTEPDSRAERLFASETAARGWSFIRRSELRTYVSGRSQAVSPLVVAQECRIDEFLEATRSFGPASASNSRPTHQQVSHYLDDPRGVVLAVARAPDDRPCAAALIIRSEIMTTSGAQFTPSLDAVWAKSDDQAALAAFATLAIDRWPGAAVVTAPNLSHISPAAIRAAGFRATRSSFSFTVIAGSTDSWLAQTSGTNLEVF